MKNIDEPGGDARQTRKSTKLVTKDSRRDEVGDRGTPLMAESEGHAEKVVTKEIDLENFSSVEVDGTFKVEITCFNSYGIAIKADEGLLDYVDIVKSGNTLRLSLKPFSFHMEPPLKVRLPIEVRPTLEARVLMPALRKLRLAAATKGIVKGFSSQDGFDLYLSGASALDIDMESGETKLEISGASRLSGKMKLGDAEFILSGASRAEISGSASRAVLSGWGASRLDLAGFTLSEASVHLKGASRATVNVNGKLDVDLSGASRLNYLGNPTLHDINVSGASVLSQR